MGIESFGLPSPSYNMESVRGVLSLALVMVLVGVFVHLAQKMIEKKSDIYHAMVAGFLAVLGAQLMFIMTSSVVSLVGFLLGLVAFALIISLVLRTKLQQGIAIGAVAWVMWIVTSICLNYVNSHWH